jgi:hypothetical protein
VLRKWASQTASDQAKLPTADLFYHDDVWAQLATSNVCWCCTSFQSSRTMHFLSTVDLTDETALCGLINTIQKGENSASTTCTTSSISTAITNKQVRVFLLTPRLLLSLV